MHRRCSTRAQRPLLFPSGARGRTAPSRSVYTEREKAFLYMYITCVPPLELSDNENKIIITIIMIKRVLDDPRRETPFIPPNIYLISRAHRKCVCIYIYIYMPTHTHESARGDARLFVCASIYTRGTLQSYNKKRYPQTHSCVPQSTTLNWHPLERASFISLFLFLIFFLPLSFCFLYSLSLSLWCSARVLLLSFYRARALARLLEADSNTFFESEGQATRP